MSAPETILDRKETPKAPAKASPSPVEIVFRKYVRLVYETALHITGHPYDAEDVVQNTFLEFFRSDRSVDMLFNPAGYFRRAAKHQALNIVRSRKQVHLTADADSFATPEAEQNVPPDDNKEQQLLAFIQTLKAEQALMIRLRYVEGHSNSNIARMLGKSEGVVKMTLFRLRRRLRELAKGEL